MIQTSEERSNTDRTPQNRSKAHVVAFLAAIGVIVGSIGPWVSTDSPIVNAAPTVSFGDIPIFSLTTGVVAAVTIGWIFLRYPVLTNSLGTRIAFILAFTMSFLAFIVASVIAVYSANTVVNWQSDVDGTASTVSFEWGLVLLVVTSIAGLIALTLNTFASVVISRTG